MFNTVDCVHTLDNLCFGLKITNHVYPLTVQLFKLGPNGYTSHGQNILMDALGTLVYHFQIFSFSVDNPRSG